MKVHFEDPVFAFFFGPCWNLVKGGLEENKKPVNESETVTI